MEPRGHPSSKHRNAAFESGQSALHTFKSLDARRYRIILRERQSILDPQLNRTQHVQLRRYLWRDRRHPQRSFVRGRVREHRHQRLDGFPLLVHSRQWDGYKFELQAGADPVNRSMKQAFLPCTTIQMVSRFSETVPWYCPASKRVKFSLYACSRVICALGEDVRWSHGGY